MTHTTHEITLALPTAAIEYVEEQAARLEASASSVVLGAIGRMQVREMMEARGLTPTWVDKTSPDGFCSCWDR